MSTQRWKASEFMEVRVNTALTICDWVKSADDLDDEALKHLIMFVARIYRPAVLDLLSDVEPQHVSLQTLIATCDSLPWSVTDLSFDHRSCLFAKIAQISSGFF